MSMSLVQSALGGNNSASFTSGAGGTVSTTGSFSSTTTAGNLLVLLLTTAQHRTSGSGFAPASSSVSTAGITWSANLLNAGPGDIGADRNGIGLFACGNAPSVASSTITTVTDAPSPSSANGTQAIEFALYEFSGVSTSFSDYSTGNGLVNAKAVQNGASGGTVNPGNITTTKTCLIVSYFRGNSSNISAGAGYLLGQNMAVLTVGQTQYALDVASGVNATAFSGTQTNWGAGAVAFQAPNVVASNSYGFFFG
jgi:hypothetical protein